MALSDEYRNLQEETSKDFWEPFNVVIEKSKECLHDLWNLESEGYSVRSEGVRPKADDSAPLLAKSLNLEVLVFPSMSDLPSLGLPYVVIQCGTWWDLFI